VAAVLIAAIWLLPDVLLRWDLGDAAGDHLAQQPTLLDAYRQTVLKVLGGVIVGVGLYFTYRRLQQTDTTNRISEEGQVTERFTRAIEQLGSEHTAIQLGGIYALERIMRDSPKDHTTVMEVLSAFIRENATEEANTLYEKDGADNRIAVGPRVQTVLQAAVTALGRRQVRPGEPRINLRGVWLREYDLRDAHLMKARLNRVHLEGTSLARAHLQGAYLGGAFLDEALLDGAHLEGANLRRAMLEGAYLRKARLQDAQLHGALLGGASLGGRTSKEPVCMEPASKEHTLTRRTWRGLVCMILILRESTCVEHSLKGLI